MDARPRSLAALAARVARCRGCERLVHHRALVAKVKRAAYRDEVYWGRPVPGFGDPNAKLVIVGLAPGAHGANRTGRVFTGDRSGDFLYAALHRAGRANQPTSTAKDDGLVLEGVWITLAARCVPPDNRPTPEEVRRCGARFLDEELDRLRPTAILALGAIAWDATLASFVRAGFEPPDPRSAKFAHGAELVLKNGRSRSLGVIASYHVSQQNTQTGRLTAAMFDRVLRHSIAVAAMSG